MNVTINWGDATANTSCPTTVITAGDLNCTYPAEGQYTITIGGTLTQFGNGALAYSNAEKIVRLESWGNLGLTSLAGAFRSATNLTEVAPPPASVTNLSHMFGGATTFNQPIGNWNTANVSDMGAMFRNATVFNQNLNCWNVTNISSEPSNFAEDSALTNPNKPVWGTTGCSPASEILMVGASSHLSSSTSLSLPKPTGTEEGHLIIVAISNRGGLNNNITPPSGWTFLREDGNASTLANRIYYRVAGSSEPANYSFSIASSVNWVGSIASYSGVDNANPINTHNGQYGATSMTLTAPSVTTTVDNTLLFAAFGYATTFCFTEDPPLTPRAQTGSEGGGGNHVRGGISDESRPTAGATGDRTAYTCSMGAAFAGTLVALKPGP